jgi:hypothetical protein
MGSAYKILVGNPRKGIEHLEDLGTDVRIAFRHLHVTECGGVDGIQLNEVKDEL